MNGSAGGACSRKRSDPHSRQPTGSREIQGHGQGPDCLGDRRQGTKRNRDAVDWIEAQLKSYGCANTERITYEYKTPVREGGGGQGAGQKPLDPVIASGEVRSGPGGSRYRGITRRTGVNNDPMRQPDEKLRALNMEPATDGQRQEVICTKVGATRPDEMYIVGAHMDGHGCEAPTTTARTVPCGSRPHLQHAGRRHDRNFRFALWNNEETGLNGARV